MFLFDRVQTLEETSMWRLSPPSSMVEEMSWLLPVLTLVSCLFNSWFFTRSNKKNKKNPNATLL